VTPRAIRAAALLGVFAVLFFLTPPDLPVCGFRWLTGRPCPLCGLTRALFALAKGHFRDAIHFHALSPLAAVLLGSIICNRPVPGRVWTLVLALFAGYGIWRIAA
jgi:uncharacterized protein DUF2752